MCAYAPGQIKHLSIVLACAAFEYRPSFLGLPTALSMNEISHLGERWTHPRSGEEGRRRFPPPELLFPFRQREFSDTTLHYSPSELTKLETDSSWKLNQTERSKTVDF